MRNEWLMSAAAAALGLLAVAGSATADNIQLARMVSPSAQNSAAERAAPTQRAATAAEEPTTIGEETLRQLIATIAPEDEATSHHHPAPKSVQLAEAKPAKTAKSAKKYRGHKHKHQARRAGSKHPEVLGGAAPARLKPCHHAHPVPAFLRDGERAAPVQPAAPWQTRQLRFGPRA